MNKLQIQIPVQNIMRNRQINICVYEYNFIVSCYLRYRLPALVEGCEQHMLAISHRCSSMKDVNPADTVHRGRNPDSCDK